MNSSVRVLVASGTGVFCVDPGRGTAEPVSHWEGRYPTCLAADRTHPARAWCGTRSGGVFRSEDGGESWQPAGLEGEAIMSVAVSPSGPSNVWVGTDPSALWRSEDGGKSWTEVGGLLDLPSAVEWSFPPKPDTHHVRWIACHPSDSDRVWLAVEAGALVETADAGTSWKDRVPGGPYDTHELAIHEARPDVLRVSAGDGYFESHDSGATWSSPMDGLEVWYLRSIVIDPGNPDVVVVSAATHARAAYVAGRSNGRLFRREGAGPWERVHSGWPDPPDTMAPLLAPGTQGGELWAADERGVHLSTDGGRQWALAVAFTEHPYNLRGLCVVTLPAP